MILYCLDLAFLSRDIREVILTRRCVFVLFASQYTRVRLLGIFICWSNKLRVATARLVKREHGSELRGLDCRVEKYVVLNGREEH